jgi:prepilin-type N-terminal cleavage/methylation domain-containing protein
MRQHNQSGFTLIELSVVLVVIGLIVGSITLGGNLLHSSKITSTVKEYSEITDSVRQYYDKYGNYPGDIGGGGQTAYDDLLTSDEIPDAWAELANKGHINGSYSGAAETENYGGGSISSYSVIGVNSPKSPIANAGYQFGTVSDYWKNQLYLRLGSHDNAPSSSADTLLEGGALTPGEAQSVDRKLDDGEPFTGKIRISKGKNAASDCHKDTAKIANGEPTGKLLKKNNEKSCNLIYFFDEYTSPNSIVVASGGAPAFGGGGAGNMMGDAPPIILEDGGGSGGEESIDVFTPAPVTY